MIENDRDSYLNLFVYDDQNQLLDLKLRLDQELLKNEDLEMKIRA